MSRLGKTKGLSDSYLDDIDHSHDEPMGEVIKPKIAPMGIILGKLCNSFAANPIAGCMIIRTDELFCGVC